MKKEFLAQVFSCEFCEISKNTFFYRTPLVAPFDPLAKIRMYFSRSMYVPYARLSNWLTK